MCRPVSQDHKAQVELDNLKEKANSQASKQESMTFAKILRCVCCCLSSQKTTHHNETTSLKGFHSVSVKQAPSEHKHSKYKGIIRNEGVDEDDFELSRSKRNDSIPGGDFTKKITI